MIVENFRNAGVAHLVNLARPAFGSVDAENVSYLNFRPGDKRCHYSVGADSKQSAERADRRQ